MFRCLGLIVGALAMVSFPDFAAAQAQKAEGRKGAAAAGPAWRLAVQAYTFNRFTFFEAVDKAKALGLKYIEAYPGQKLSKEKPDVVFHHDMSAEAMKDVQAQLEEAGITLVNYGVVDLGKDEAAARKVFVFAKKMGIRTIVSEPDPQTLGTLDKLAREFAIRVAIHNHPKPSKYWSPESVLDAVTGHSRMIGACADTGHWPRSGVDPVAALKSLKGRIVCLHFKDLNELNKREAHDVPWGTGKCDVKAMLAELKEQNFRGVFSIEYEHNWENSMPEIAECIKTFHKMAGELGMKSE